MVPYDHNEFINILTTLVENKVIPMSRIDDAVRRILRVKFTMGLFENPLADLSLFDQLGSQVSYYTFMMHDIYQLFDSLSSFFHSLRTKK